MCARPASSSTGAQRAGRKSAILSAPTTSSASEPTGQATRSLLMIDGMGIVGCQNHRPCKYGARGIRTRMAHASSLPVIDMSPLLERVDSRAKLKVARAIEDASRDLGFFYATGHGISSDLFTRLDSASRKFFALSDAEKLEIRMSRGGRAWRGYFPVGGELTSGKADLKEGLYFGTELPSDHPRVRAGVPL